MTFKNWLLNCSDQSEYGLFVVDIENDNTFPDSDNYLEMFNYLIGQNAGGISKQLFNKAWEDYLTECNQEEAQ